MAASERLAEVSQTRADWFWPLIYTAALHAILFALLFVSFNLTPQIPAAQPLIQATVYQLKAERPKSTPVPDKITAEAQKTKAAEREAEQLEQQKRQREAEQKQKAEQAAALAKAAESKRQAEAAKAAEALKQAEEQARQVAEQAQKQAAEAKRLEAEQKQREADAAKKRAAEQARQKAEAEAAEAKRKAEEAARQKREAEAKRKQEAEAKRQREAEEAKRRAEEERKAKARAELLAAEAQRRKAQGESERLQLIASLDELFVRLVSEQWIRPASTRDGISSEIQVSMLPDGTIGQVILVRSSGDTPFDNSTLAALRSIGRIPEMQQLDRASFDALYRKRNLIFRPEDLER
ncbi:hypothetical protein AXE65_03130 [Ventosimonas gracilis]|uniref:Protein TolA n=1 Tax=Ventosimonas gracilis TaxID=1680762 RepID=A0A139SSE5_9GAMM|nr:cell envelope integrity protein TolA [Ventosimonas gracilis]KXU37488.1 hypothetical protein AXE65_03130 [Ventosimonas gracilis]